VASERLKAKTAVQYRYGWWFHFALAGLWERWLDSHGSAVETCTILTTTPNALVADVHNRMPAILYACDYDLWLGPRTKDPALVARCLRPFDANLMKKYPVSTRVNRPENDDPECAQEVSIAASQMLFWRTGLRRKAPHALRRKSAFFSKIPFTDISFWRW
jgi:putative SOS response-associated peptidase YedK